MTTSTAAQHDAEASASSSIVRRATVGSEPSRDLSPHSIAGRPRRKSITIACERCRRRKIRCDGDQPCATCARFSVACIRPTKHKERFGPEAQAALEERVRNLERQLSESRGGAKVGHIDLSDEGFNNWPEVGESAATSHQRQLRLNTTFQPPPRSFSFDDDQIGGYSAASLTSPDIPMIEITGCETPYSRPMSPSPSLLSQSATSRASSPDPYSVSTPGLVSQLIPGKHGPSISPPISPYNSQVWDFGAAEEYTTFLSPPTGAGQSSSRRSSISSLGLDQDLGSMNLAFPEFQDFSQAFDLPPNSINNMQFPAPTSSPQPHALGNTSHGLPSKQDAQNLSLSFFDWAEGVGLTLPVERHHVYTCIEAVYSLSDFNAPGNEESHQTLNGYPLGFAKFQVFLILTAAYKLRRDRPGTTNLLIAERLYQLAMAQTLSSRFWSEDGGPEMASLLGVYALATKSFSS